MVFPLNLGGDQHLFLHASACNFDWISMFITSDFPPCFISRVTLLPPAHGIRPQLYFKDEFSFVVHEARSAHRLSDWPFAEFDGSNAAFLLEEIAGFH